MKTFVKIIIPFIIGFIIFQLFFHFVLKPDINKTSQSTDILKVDSLQNVINELQIESEEKAKQWDKLEKNYASILFEYQYGLESIQHTHPSAYREFHRIISYKEDFNRVDEIENNKRLAYGKFDK